MSSSSTYSMILTITQQYTISTIFIIVIMGLIGNCLNILVFTKLKIFQNNQCIFYLISESIVDIGLLIYNFSIRLLTFLYGLDIWYYSSAWCKLRIIIGQTFVLFLFSTVCFTAFDQFLSTSYSFYLRQRSTMKLARRLVIVAICFSLSHSIAFGVFFEAKPLADCAASYPILLQYYSYFFYPVLCGLLPILISGSFSILAYRNVRRITRRQIPIVRRRLDRQLTKFVLMRVTFLIILNTPFVIYRIYSINIIINPRDSIRLAIERLIQAIINSFLYLNYAINFYLFWASSSRYRRQVKCVLIKKYWQQWKRRFYPHCNQIDPSIAPPVFSIELE